MATEVPQRALRNETAALLRRVEQGERLRVTVHGHPVAEIGPVPSLARFLERDALIAGLGGTLSAEDRLEQDLRREDPALDPFA